MGHFPLEYSRTNKEYAYYKWNNILLTGDSKPPSLAVLKYSNNEKQTLFKMILILHICLEVRAHTAVLLYLWVSAPLGVAYHISSISVTIYSSNKLKL